MRNFCNMLDIKNTSDAISRLDDDEKLLSVLPTATKKTLVSLISESGLYALVFRSAKPEAKKFRKWITQEVIPTIRKTGSYQIRPGGNMRQAYRFLVRIGRIRESRTYSLCRCGNSMNQL